MYLIAILFRMQIPICAHNIISRALSYSKLQATICSVCANSRQLSFRDEVEDLKSEDTMQRCGVNRTVVKLLYVSM